MPKAIKQSCLLIGYLFRYQKKVFGSAKSIIKPAFNRLPKAFESFKIIFVSVRDSLKLIRNDYTLIRNDFEQVRDAFASVRNAFASVRNAFASVRNAFASVRDAFASVRDAFSAIIFFSDNIFWRAVQIPNIPRVCYEILHVYGYSGELSKFPEMQFVAKPIFGKQFSGLGNRKLKVAAAQMLA